MSFNTKGLKYHKIGGVDSHEVEVGYDKMYSSGVRQSPRPNNVPIFRDNGYQLELEELNEDHIELDSAYTLSVGESIFLDYQILDSISNKWLFGRTTNSTNYIQLSVSTSGLVLRNGSGIINISFPDSNILNKSYSIEVKRTSTDFELYNDGVLVNSITNTIGDVRVDQINRRRTSSSPDMIISYFKLGSNEAVSFESFNGVDVVDDSGTKVGEIKTIHVDGNDYIEREVVQKKSFSLVGNGTTEKIVSPLGIELILTSTPLEGGFTLDGKIYDLKEGLGTKILSRDGTTESEIVGFTGKSLNYGGWRKGNNVDGWTAYD
tara:strand:- start:2476 stop:3435 length:960 start_codon:yes stop_codon:yes gene_type:complete